MASTLQFTLAVEFFFRQCVARNEAEEVLCCLMSLFLDSFLRKMSSLNSFKISVLLLYTNLTIYRYVNCEVHLVDSEMKNS